MHEQDGTLWNPERLSRGTREQVFLALRLALIRDLGRHDVSLPLVMDDALVNFDDQRAPLAARVLVEFVAEQAADRQPSGLVDHTVVERSRRGAVWRRPGEPGRLREVAKRRVLSGESAARTASSAAEVPASSRAIAARASRRNLSLPGCALTR